MKAIAERIRATHTGSLPRLPWLPIAERLARLRDHLISRELWVLPEVAGKTRVSWPSSRAEASEEWCWPRIGLCRVAGAHYGGGGP